MICQLLTIDSGQLIAEDDGEHHPLVSTAKSLKRKTLKKLQHKMMFCGNLLSWGPHGLHFASEIDEEKIWDGVAEALYRIRRNDRLHGQTDYVMVKDVPPTPPDSDSPSGPDLLQRYRYKNHETEPDMVLHLDPQWSSFDDYLASLNKKYRKAAKTNLKNIDQSELSIRRHDRIPTDHATDIHRLYLETHSRASVRLLKLTPTYLATLAATLGPGAFRCTTLHNSDNGVVGFVTTLKDGDTAIGYYLGVDYEANGRAPIYHRLLYAVIEDALDLGCRKISFGRTALEPKARLGCTPDPMSISIRHRVPIVNMLIQPLLRAIDHAEPPERSPFKAK